MAPFSYPKPAVYFLRDYFFYDMNLLILYLLDIEYNLKGNYET